LTHRDSRIAAPQRVKQWHQRPATIWLTGLVGAGKTKIAYALEKKLFALGAVCLVLDGENVRMGINRELDFSAAGRAEHLRRVAEIARLANDSGIIVICAFVSPEAAIRGQLAVIVGPERFIEIYLEASAEWCGQRDGSGLYAKARRSELRNFAGVNSAYDVPAQPALSLPVEKISTPAAVNRILDLLRQRDYFPCSSGKIDP
jgi:adenylylsulfate kinase